MSYSNSPLNFNLASIAAGAVGKRGVGNSPNDAQIQSLQQAAGRKGPFGKIASNLLKKFEASRAQTAGVAGAATAPSAVQTAGATNMGERINTIESRLSTLESGSDSAGAMQSASEVAPPADMGGEAMPVDMSAPAISAAPQMPAVEEPIIPQSEQLGSLMASPFMVRQRKKMGPLNLNSPLNGNTFAKAVQDAKATGASTFKVGGKTYNVK
jgi:hypothetical protein